jgi:hypothetical protein
VVSETGRRKERFLRTCNAWSSQRMRKASGDYICGCMALRFRAPKQFAVLRASGSDTFPVNKHDCKDSDQAGYDFAAFNSRNVDTVLTGYLCCEN